MHFATCSIFFAKAKIWWPQGVIWMLTYMFFVVFMKSFAAMNNLMATKSYL